MTAASILLYTDRTLLPSSKSDRVAAYLYAHTSEVRKQQRTIQDIVTIAGDLTLKERDTYTSLALSTYI